MVLDWIVIGAGPAGIAAVGKLIDSGIPPGQIGWIDPHFAVGDLGLKWNRVPSNTKVALFLKYLQECKAFNNPKNFKIHTLNPEETCQLQDIVEPLQWITDQFKKQVHVFTEMAMALQLSQGRWEVKMKKASAFAKKVVLAVGADPKSLSLTEHEILSVETALHPEKLAKAVSSQDIVGVFGSSHTAFLVLANLYELKIKTINFYRSPHRYAVYLNDWILFDDIGLKGFTARWAKQHIDGTWPSTLTRVCTADRTFEEALAPCSKLVYATGFERRKLPVLEQFGKLHYDDKTGIIAPNLFGFGIAFPQAKFDRLGHVEFRVGLWKFMDYLNGILPIWLST